MTGDRVQQIRERIEAADPKDWSVEMKRTGTLKRPICVVYTRHGYMVNPGTGEWNEPAHAELVANAPADLAYLLEKLSEAQRIARVNAALYRSAEAELARLKGEK